MQGLGERMKLLKSFSRVSCVTALSLPQVKMFFQRQRVKPKKLYFYWYRIKLSYYNLRVGYSVLIKSLFDSTKIVAKKVLHSMDPNTIVGRQMLGLNWCGVRIQIVLELEESLIRPYDLLQRFEDTLGGMIAWPYHLV